MIDSIDDINIFQDDSDEDKNNININLQNKSNQDINIKLIKIESLEVLTKNSYKNINHDLIINESKVKMQN